MARLRLNQSCPCGSEQKYKKCCAPFLQGTASPDHVERLLRSRYVAAFSSDVEYLWNSLHPESPFKLYDNKRKFDSEHQVLANLEYTELIILDGNIDAEKATVVYFVRVKDGDQDVSYLEEADLQVFEGSWFYKDGLRRSASKIKIDPSLIKVGDLASQFPWDGGLN